MSAVLTPTSCEIMDVLIEVRHERRATTLVFIDSAGQTIVLKMSGNVARDLRDELNELGERMD